MLAKQLVCALEDDWRAILDGVARARRWPASDEVEKLGAEVAKLSRAYNESQPGARLAPGDAGELAARLGFSFARDVPKGAGAVRELVATGALAMPEGRDLRVLDVGAGLGATTWGVARALEAAGGRGAIDATWIDADVKALGVAMSIVDARAAKGEVAVRARAVPKGLARGVADLDATYDVVLMGQVLSELHVGEEDAARVEKHAALVRDLVDRVLEPTGTLVIVEPALRNRTRHLHRVRDALLAAPHPPTVFAPCLHAAACPALVNEGDWCHEDLAVDLPAWLVPVARAAGLRFQGLTFSYLALRRDGRTLAAGLAAGRGGRLRVVSDPLASKGKHELFLCGELGSGDGALVPGRARAMRLDRNRAPGNEVWEELVRGDVIAIAPPPDNTRARIEKDALVARLTEPSFASNG